MKQEKNKLISSLLSSFENDCKTKNDLKWLKAMKMQVKEIDLELSKLDKNKTIERFKDDLIQLNNSNIEDSQFIKGIKVNLNEKRKRMAS